MMYELETAPVRRRRRRKMAALAAATAVACTHKSDKKAVIATPIPKRSDHLRLEEVEFVLRPGRGRGYVASART